VFELAHPWALALLPLPIIVRWLLPAHRMSVQAVRVPFFDRFVSATGETPRDGAVVLRRRALQMIPAALIWILMVAALAKPEWVGEPIERTEAARDLMLAIDISGSMDERDFKLPDGTRLQRLDAVKKVVGEFIERREGDRIGLIVFGTRAYVQVPFTQDLETARTLLDSIEVGMAGPHTALGDSIGLAIKTFEVSEVDQKLLIVLTDGADTGSMMTPINAAEIAHRHQVEVHAIGVGDPEGSGEDRVDFLTLKEIAARANGKFFSADDVAGLEQIYARIDQLVPRDEKTLSFRPRQSLVHWPLSISLVIGMCTYALMLLLGRRQAANVG
jgi:Ca-activated chloride channel family protein